MRQKRGLGPLQELNPGDLFTTGVKGNGGPGIDVWEVMCVQSAPTAVLRNVRTGEEKWGATDSFHQFEPLVPASVLIDCADRKSA